MDLGTLRCKNFTTNDNMKYQEKIAEIKSKTAYYRIVEKRRVFKNL